MEHRTRNMLPTRVTEMEYTDPRIAARGGGRKAARGECSPSVPALGWPTMGHRRPGSGKREPAGKEDD